MRRVRAGLALALILVGSVAIAYPLLVYELDGTRASRLTAAVDEALHPAGASSSLDERARLRAPVGTRASPTSARPTASATGAQAEPLPFRTRPILEVPAPQEGQALGIIDIPAIGLRTAFFEGISDSTLLTGPGHLPWTATPGTDGVSVIAAHRDLQFSDLKDVRYGNRIFLELPSGTTVYHVTGMRISGPSQTQVAGGDGHSELRLLTCWPPTFIGPAPQRLLVTAVPGHTSPAPAPPLHRVEGLGSSSPSAPTTAVASAAPGSPALAQLPVAPRLSVTEILPFIGASGAGVASLATFASSQGDRRRGWFFAFMAGALVLDGALAYGLLR